MASLIAELRYSRTIYCSFTLARKDRRLHELLASGELFTLYKLNRFASAVLWLPLACADDFLNIWPT